MRWQWMGWQIHQLKGRSFCGFKPQQNHNSFAAKPFWGRHWTVYHDACHTLALGEDGFQLLGLCSCLPLQGWTGCRLVRHHDEPSRSQGLMNVGRTSITEKVGYQYSWSLVTRNTSTSRLLKKPQELNKRNTYNGLLYRHTGNFDSATCW